MENVPHNNQAEEDKAAAAKAERYTAEEEDDDDEEEEKEKPTPRHVPLVSVEKADEADEEEEHPKPKLSITDRLLEKIGAKPEEPTEEVDEQPSEHIVPESTPLSHEPDQTAPLTTEMVLPASELSREEPAVVPAAEPSGEVMETKPPTLEASDWDTEEEIAVGPETPTVQHSSGEVIPEEPEEGEVFAEIPSEPEGGLDAESEPVPVEPELLERGLGGEEPPEPPEDEPATPAPRGVPPRRGSSSGGGSGFVGASGSAAAERPWYDAAAADRARQDEIDTAEYEARRSGIRKGLGTGLLFGWMFGRHGKKKQARDYEKQLKAKNSEIKVLKSQQIAATERIEAVRRVKEQLQSDILKRGLERPAAAEKSPQVPPIVLERVVETVKMAERPKAVPKFEKASVQKSSGRSMEFVTVAAAARSERLRTVVEKPPIPELRPEHQLITEETYKVEDGHRVETSAWHRIEIDEKTGKPVENPEVAYGNEFKREQRQEIFSETPVIRDTTTKAEQQPGSKKAASREETAPLVQLGGLAAASYTARDSTDSSPHQVQKTPDSHQASVDLRSAPAEQTKAKGRLRYARNPVVWGVGLLIVVVLFVVGILR
jgi:hypothetical protein